MKKMLSTEYLYVGRWCLYVLLSMMMIQPIIGQVNQPSAESIPNQKLNNLLQGRIYFSNYVKIVGSQYITEDWRIGKIKFMDEVYTDLPLWYDIYSDELILIDWQGKGFGMIRLNREHLESFEFDNRHFVNPRYSKYEKYNLGNRFHEVIGEGAVTLLISRKLVTQRDDVVDYFVRKDAKVLIHEGQAYNFRNKKSFLKSVPPIVKDDIAKFIRKNNIQLKKASNSDWDQLINLINELMGSKNVGK